MFWPRLFNKSTDWLPVSLFVSLIDWLIGKVWSFCRSTTSSRSDDLLHPFAGNSSCSTLVQPNNSRRTFFFFLFSYSLGSTHPVDNSLTRFVVPFPSSYHRWLLFYAHLCSQLSQAKKPTCTCCFFPCSHSYDCLISTFLSFFLVSSHRFVRLFLVCLPVESLAIDSYFVPQIDSNFSSSSSFRDWNGTEPSTHLSGKGTSPSTLSLFGQWVEQIDWPMPTARPRTGLGFATMHRPLVARSACWFSATTIQGELVLSFLDKLFLLLLMNRHTEVMFFHQTCDTRVATFVRTFWLQSTQATRNASALELLFFCLFVLIAN